MKRKEGPPYSDPVEPDSRSLDSEARTRSAISSFGELGEGPSDASGKPPELVIFVPKTEQEQLTAAEDYTSTKDSPVKRKPKNLNMARRQVRGRGKSSVDSDQKKTDELVSFSTSAQISVDQPASEFTGAAFRNLPPEPIRVTINGDMPDSGPKADSLAEVRARLQNLVKQAGHQNETVVEPPQVEEKQMSPEEVRMQELEAKLREQTKKFYAKENRLFRLGHSELRKTEQEYNRSLFELAKSKKSSGELNGLEIVNEVIRKGVDAKREARKDALSIDDRYGFEKALELIPLSSKWLDTNLGKNKARATRAFVTAVAVVGGGAALGAFGTASIGALLGYGTYKFARSFGSAVLGAAAAKVSGSFLDRMLGRTQGKANEELSGLSLEGEPDAKVFEEMRIRIEKLVEKADDKTKERKKLIYQGLVAMGVGGGANAFLTLFDVGMPFGSSHSTESSATKEAAQPLRVETPTPTAPSEPVPPAASTETVSVLSEERPTPPVSKPEAVRIEHAPAEPSVSPEPTPEPIGASISESESVPEDGSEMTTAELNRASLVEATQAVESLDNQEPSVPEERVVEVPQEPEVTEALTPTDTHEEISVPEQNTETQDAIIEPEVVEETEIPKEESTADGGEPLLSNESTVDTSDAGVSPVEHPATPTPNEAGPSNTPGTPPENVEAATEQPAERSEAPVAREMSPFTNMHNLSIDPRVPEVFSNADGTITVYGGTFADRFNAAQDYAQEHPGKVVHLEASRPLRGEDGVLRPWITRVFVDPASLQMNADASPAGPQFIGSPDPQTFTAMAR